MVDTSRSSSTNNTQAKEAVLYNNDGCMDSQAPGGSRDVVATQLKKEGKERKRNEEASITIDERDVTAVTIVTMQLRDEELEGRTWKDDIFFSMCNNLWPSLICSFTCPCLALAQMGNRVHFMQFHHSIIAYTVLIGFSAITYFFLSVDTIIIVWFFMFWMTWNIRDRIRRQDNLHGSYCIDMLLSFWCNPCTVAHTMRHLYDYNSLVECDQGTCSLDGEPCRRSRDNRHVVPISLYDAPTDEGMGGVAGPQRGGRGAEAV